MGFSPVFLLTDFGAIAHSLTSFAKTEKLSITLVQAASASIFQSVETSVASKSVQTFMHDIHLLLVRMLSLHHLLVRVYEMVMNQVGSRMLLVRVAIQPAKQHCVVVRHFLTSRPAMVVSWRNPPPIFSDGVAPSSVYKVDLVYVTPLLPAAFRRRWRWEQVPSFNQWIELYVCQARCAHWSEPNSCPELHFHCFQAIGSGANRSPVFMVLFGSENPYWPKSKR